MEIVLPLRKTCYYSPLAEVGVFSTEIKLKKTGLFCRNLERNIQYYRKRAYDSFIVNK
ncbi:hypothetical protein HMPREF0373_01681 [Eubacterium ramulus ATCC 29099]|uniref:Uncharacterized protein n=1 Tax=Eubacterium ramulus ATCC 29099 TaxID=1256908 RepID=U2PSE7_EUBRA|nr:hypothetical protein HMPREF0373_01681 [Eubacterium ramulus ATCC 29099]